MVDWREPLSRGIRAPCGKIVLLSYSEPKIYCSFKQVTSHLGGGDGVEKCFHLVVILHCERWESLGNVVMGMVDEGREVNFPWYLSWKVRVLCHPVSHLAWPSMGVEGGAGVSRTSPCLLCFPMMRLSLVKECRERAGCVCFAPLPWTSNCVISWRI